MTSIYQGLTEGSATNKPRLFVEIAEKLVDVRCAYATYLQEIHHAPNAEEIAGDYFPPTMAAFLNRGNAARHALVQCISFAQQRPLENLYGPHRETIVYDFAQVRLLPPVHNPEKSIVIGFSDRARAEGMPPAELPTGFYKLPQTFITTGTPILWPRFSKELDVDACLALVIGKAGKRIAPNQAWEHVAGVTLMLDITARDINRREGATTNNLLGKNFPTSTALGPGLLLAASHKRMEQLEVELRVDDDVKQRFSLRECVFTVPQIIARWSILGIKPGDLLAIGASMSREHEALRQPVPLRAGSTIHCIANGIGSLSHTVIAPNGAHA